MNKHHSAKNLSQLKFAVGEIIWQKKSGAKVSLAKKGDSIYFPLIKKLIDSGEEIVMTTGLEESWLNEFLALVTEYKNELLMKNKITIRKKILGKLCQKFLNEENDHFDLSVLLWKVFAEDSQDVLSLKGLCDRPLFKRSLCLTTSVTLCAFIVGYYDYSFLKQLYFHNLNQFYLIENSPFSISLKEKLEKFRLSEKFNKDELLDFNNFFDNSFISKTVLFEKRNGAGLRKLKLTEMTDVENIFLSLNENYSYFENDFSKESNMLMQIYRGEVDFDRKILKGMQRVLDECSSLG